MKKGQSFFPCIFPVVQAWPVILSWGLSLLDFSLQVASVWPLSLSLQSESVFCWPLRIICLQTVLGKYKRHWGKNVCVMKFYISKWKPWSFILFWNEKENLGDINQVSWRNMLGHISSLAPSASWEAATAVWPPAVLFWFLMGKLAPACSLSLLSAPTQRICF